MTVTACSRPDSSAMEDGGNGSGGDTEETAEVSDGSEDSGTESSDDGSGGDDCLSSVETFLACSESLNATQEELDVAGTPQQLTEPTPPQEVRTDDDIVVVCTSTDYALTEAPHTYMSLDPNAATLYPGSLVQSAAVGDGILQGVLVDQLPGAVTLTLLSGAQASFTRDVDPSLDEVTQAMNDILAEHEDQEIPAGMAFDLVRMHSEEQLAVEFHAAASGTTWSAGVDLGASQGAGHNRLMVRFTQQYFTMAYTPDDGILSDSVTVEDLLQFEVGPLNPLAYVSSVTYGRDFFVLFESTEDFSSLEAAVRAAYDSQALEAGAEVSLEHRRVLENASVTGIARGGDSQMATQALSGDVDDVLDFIRYGANTEDYFEAVPLSYAVKYVHNNELLQLPLTSEFTLTDCAPIDSSEPLSATVEYIGMEFTNAEGCEGPLEGAGDFWYQIAVNDDAKIDMSCDKDAHEPEPVQGVYWDDRRSGTTWNYTFDYEDGLTLALWAEVHDHDGAACGINNDSIGSDLRELTFADGEWDVSASAFTVPDTGQTLDTVSISGDGSGCQWNAHFTVEIDEG